MYVDNAPVAMKVSVATRERPEKRLKPHTPWPLVQPWPRRVPNPTNNPPAMANPIGTGVEPSEAG